MLKPAAILKAEAQAEHEAVMAAVRRFARRCAEQFAASEVYLFGSRARGNWRRGSDADVIVVSERFAGVPMPARPVPLYALWDGPPMTGIEPICLTPEEFEAAKGRVGIVAMAFADGAVPLLGEQA